MIEVLTLGGFKEVGRNCTAVRVDNEVVILDLGLKMEEYVAYTQDEDVVEISGKKLIEHNAAPDVFVMGDWKDKVVGIILGHAHLDHIGAVPFLANKFKADIHGSPFTIEVLRAMLDDKKTYMRNQLKTEKLDTPFKLSQNITVELISMTHSTPQTALIAIYTKYGTVLYANDFKLDLFPVLGKTPSFNKLRSLKPRIMVIDSLYADAAMKTPSERVAKEMLRDVFISTNAKNNAVVVTTFSSHIERLKSIIDFGNQLNRKIVFLGRSLSKYVEAAEKVGLVKFSKEVEMVKYGEKIQKFIKTVKRPQDYLFVVTGHQGEPKATLSKMLKFFNFKPDDVVIFSCKIIPTPISIKNRESLEEELRKRKVRIFKDIHVSGHGSREDLRDLLQLVKPEKIIPAHAELPKLLALKQLALEIGYKESDVYILGNNERVKIP
ncbi:MBL fold metallo-hydrolase [Candidatus Woesearchaeota archaeon]|nr:MAG: MBL fold metallo-hydrolase [Candidatus Woesearchaeota archaeon]